MKKTLSIEDVVSFLNSLIAIDPKAMSALLETRVLCSFDLAKHPTVQVVSSVNEYCVGFLGILNGMFGVDERGWGPVEAVFDLVCPEHGHSKDCHFETETSPCAICGQKPITELVKFTISSGWEPER
jgi:hypothetical protein